MVLLALACGEPTDPDVADASAAHVCEGDRFVGDAETLAALTDCTHVAGNLVFTGGELYDVELSTLRSVEGSFSIWGNPNLTAAKLSGLVRVGGYFLIEANDILTRVDFPKLQRINERKVMHLADVSISGNPKLPTCQAHKLRDQLQAHGFTGSIKVSENLGSCPE